VPECFIIEREFTRALVIVYSTHTGYHFEGIKFVMGVYLSILRFCVDVAEQLADLFLQGIQGFSCLKFKKYASELTP
jgi:bacteriorhodopsin